MNRLPAPWPHLIIDGVTARTEASKAGRKPDLVEKDFRSVLAFRILLPFKSEKSPSN